MKILQLAQFFEPVIGGEETHIRTLCQCLADRGHDVTLVTFATAGDEGTTHMGGVRVVRVRPTASSIPFVYSDRSWPHAMPVPDPAVARAIRDEIEHNTPDVVHAHNWIVNSALGAVKRAGLPLLMTLHDYSQSCATKRMRYKNERDCTGPAVSKCLRCSADKFGVAAGTVTLAGNAVMSRRRRAVVAEAMSVSAVVGARVAPGRHSAAAAGIASEVVPNFIADESVVARPAEVGPDAPIVFIGDMSRDKGVHVLLEAYRSLETSTPLLLIGRHTPETPWPLPDGATATGPLPHAEAMKLVRDARVLVAPSTWQDPCPTVVLEGMAAGRPVIGSAVGGITDMVVDGVTGFLVEPSDPTSLAGALRAVLSDPERSALMGLAGLDRVARFTVSAVVDRIEAAYAQHVADPVTSG